MGRLGMGTRDAYGRARCLGNRALRNRRRPAEKVAVPAPEITFQLLDGTRAAEHEAELRALHAEEYSAPPHRRRPRPAPPPAPGAAPPARVRPRRGTVRRLPGRLRDRDAAAAVYL